MFYIFLFSILTSEFAHVGVSGGYTKGFGYDPLSYGGFAHIGYKAFDVRVESWRLQKTYWGRQRIISVNPRIHFQSLFIGGTYAWAQFLDQKTTRRLHSIEVGFVCDRFVWHLCFPDNSAYRTSSIGMEYRFGRSPFTYAVEWKRAKYAGQHIYAGCLTVSYKFRIKE